MRIRTRSFIILFSQGLTHATMIVLGVILVRLISKEMLGTYRQAILAATVVGSMLSLQLESSLYYFIPKCGLERRRRLVVQTFLIGLLMATAAGTVLWFGAEPISRMFTNPDLVPLLRICVLFPLLERLSNLIPAFMISVDRAVRAGAYSLIRDTSRIGAVVTACALDQPLTVVISCMLAVLAIVTAVGAIDMLRLSPSGSWRPDRRLLGEQLGYAWPLWATVVVGVMNMRLGKLLISTFFTPAQYAVYSCGAFELPVVTLVTASLTRAIMPNLVTLADEGKPRDALWVWQEAARKGSLIVFPCCAFFMATGRDVVTLLYGSAYALAVLPFLIYLLDLPMRVAIFGSILRAFAQTRAIAISALLALITNAVVSTALVAGGAQPLLAFLSPDWPRSLALWMMAFVGPAVGFVCSVAVVNSYCLYHVSKAVDLRLSETMRWRDLGVMLGASALCGVVIAVLPLPAWPLVVTLGIRAAVFAGLLTGLTLGCGLLKDDERTMALQAVGFVRRVLKGGKREAPAE